jgi:hypothetical protein
MSFTKMVYGGVRYPPVDSSLERTGEIYGVEPTGDLRWYFYNGVGQYCPDGSKNFATNSGNTIGNGWGIFRFLCGGGDGVIFGIEPSGDLRWYRYVAADGVEDRSASRGWDTNSGNIIGNGWSNFVNVVCTWEVRRVAPSPVSTLFGVEPNGDVRWYQYVGDGTADRWGITGWAPQSGLVVDRDWRNYRTLAAAGSTIFSVDEDGYLRWHRYGDLENAKPNGNAGWHRNSGNVIGNGWDRFIRIVAGLDDSSGFGVVFYAVDAKGGLYWYKYHGGGESDPSGSSGWNANSGNQIGQGW